jgi:hypothetical protein
VAAIALVASCSTKTDSSAPTKLPPPITATPTPTPTQTPGPEVEVEQAVRTYFATADRAVKTGDTAQLVTLSLPSCPCRGLVQDINTVYANGRADNAALTLMAVKIKEVQGSTAGAEVQYVVPAYKVVDHQGHVTEEVPYSQGDDYLSLVR